MTCTCLLRALLVLAGMSMSNAMAYAQDEKLALVIGNGAYKSEALRNPTNDSRAVGQVLRSLGFGVIERENVGFRDLIGALREFSMRARHSQVRLLYYAGHGIQVKGRNYLIPVDAEIADAEDLPRNSADLNDLLDRFGDLRSGVNVVILDACRNNPFNYVTITSNDGRRVRVRAPSSAQGLARTEPPSGTLIAYSTAPGAIAVDSGSESNSIYTRHLLANFSTPGQTVEQLFKKVRKGVATETKNMQVPWEASSLMGDYCFSLGSGGRCGSD